jgi:hypothetical protein
MAAPRCNPTNVKKLVARFDRFLQEEIEEGNEVTAAGECELLLLAYEDVFEHPVNALAIHCQELVIEAGQFIAARRAQAAAVRREEAADFMRKLSRSAEALDLSSIIVPAPKPRRLANPKGGHRNGTR